MYHNRGKGAHWPNKLTEREREKWGKEKKKKEKLNLGFDDFIQMGLYRRWGFNKQRHEPATGILQGDEHMGQMGWPQYWFFKNQSLLPGNLSNSLPVSVFHVLLHIALVLCPKTPNEPNSSHPEAKIGISLRRTVRGRKIQFSGQHIQLVRLQQLVLWAQF